MAYEKTIWVNDDEPFIEADNLNKIENELELLDTSKSDLLNAINNPTYTTTEGTDLSINDTRVGKMKFEYYGNTEQTTYEGNQLLDFENPSSATASTTSVFLNDVLTISSTSGSYRNASWDILTLLQGNADKTLKFVYKTINDNPYKAVQIRIKNNGTNTYINLLSENLIIPSDVSGITEAIISVFSNNSSTSREATTIITEPMLQFGTIVKDYEPYTGGIASPNPDYPQEVKIVTGENTINIVGKNLYGTSIDTENMSGSSFTIVKDSSDKLELQGISAYYSGVYKKYKLKPNTQYIISTYYSDLENSARGRLYYKLGTSCDTINVNTSDGFQEIGTTKTSMTFTTDSTGLVAIMFTCNWTTNNGHIVYNEIQIEKSSTATTYEPYKENNYEINLGENLLPNQIATQLTNGVNFIRNADGSLTINSSNSTGGRFYFSNDITLEAGSYTFSTKELSNATAYISFQENGTEIWSMNLKNLRTKKLDLASTTTFRPSLYCSNGQSYNNFTLTPMLVKGETERPYQPYFEPIELCKIGDYQDYIYNNGGTWYKSKIIEKIKLTGASEESWGLYAVVGSSPRRFGLNDTTRFYQNSIPIMSDYFIGSEIPRSRSSRFKNLDTNKLFRNYGQQFKMGKRYCTKDMATKQ